MVRRGSVGDDRPSGDATGPGRSAVAGARLLGAALAVVVGAEAALRFAEARGGVPAAVATRLVEPHPVLGWVPRAGHAGSVAGARVTVRADGTRGGSGDRVDAAFAADAVEVWLSGDSFAFGWGLADDQTVAARLERLLPTGSRVANLGVPGYSARQAAARLRAYRPEAAPAVVVHLVNPLDFAEEERARGLLYRRPRPGCLPPADCAVVPPGPVSLAGWNASALLRGVLRLEESLALSWRVRRLPHGAGDRAVGAVRAEALRRGARFVGLLHVPAMVAGWVDPDSLPRGGDLLDVTRLLVALDRRGAVGPDGVHWAPAGAEAVARIARAVLGRDPSAGPSLPPCAAGGLGGDEWECRDRDGVVVRSRSFVPDGEHEVLVEQVWVPPGPGLQGSLMDDVEDATRSIRSVYGRSAGPEYFRNETPPRVVQLEGFWMDRTEVTRRAFGIVRGALRAGPTRGEVQGGLVAYRGRGQFDPVLGASWWRPGWGSPEPADSGTLPVVGVTYGEAAAHCDALGLVLPTDAWWERAARGPDGRRYPWGAAPPDCRLANGGFPPGGRVCRAGAAPVGTHPDGRSPSGAEDMAGNVFEWVRDCRTDDYLWMGFGEDWLGFPVEPEAGPKVSVGGCAARMLRGGSWAFGYDAYLRPAARAFERADDLAEWSVGFRCAAPPDAR